MEKTKERKSGIELLRIIAVILIVVSHVTQTLIPIENGNIDTEIINLIVKNHDFFAYVILIFFRFLGGISNTIFMAISAYFLIDNDKVKKNKVINILLTNSILYIIMYIIISISKINVKLNDLIVYLFPTTFGMNWFITCYLIIYIVHGFLNKAINNSSKKELLLLTLFLLFINSIIQLIVREVFCINSIMEFITIYVIIAYFKKYAKDFNKDVVKNVLVLIISIISICVFIIVLTSTRPIFAKSIINSSYNTSPFNIVIAITILNIFSHLKLNSKSINYIASLSLLMYIIHENPITLGYLRPNIWKYILSNYGYNNLILKILIFVVIYYILCLLIAIVFKETFGRLIKIVSNKVSSKLEKIEDKYLKI